MTKQKDERPVAPALLGPKHPSGAIIDLYRRNANGYDRVRGRALVEREWLDRFAALLPNTARLLDIGCGGGEPIAAYLIGLGHQVTGVDASPEMIGLCEERFPGQNWLIGDMRRLALGRRFDGLIAWDSFFHLSPRDQRRMFPIFARHAAPRAALMFTSGPAEGEAIGSFQGEPLYHASLDPEEYQCLLGEYGFVVVAHAAEDPSCGHHTVWLARVG